MRCGYVCVAGPPNAGKSTLMNTILKQKVCIVTHKAQTTRVVVECIYSQGDSQAIFLDTPGMLAPKSRLQKSMDKEARKAMGRGDINILFLDASASPDKYIHLGDRFQILILNKVDQIQQKESLLKLTKNLMEKQKMDKVFMISARTGDGVEGLLSYVLASLPEREWIYQDEEKTSLTREMWAAEMTRETILSHIHQEVPYGVWVKTVSWEETGDKVRAEQVIYVTRESHKGMLLGNKGTKISLLGRLSREKMSRSLKKAVHLFLQIKVDKSWQDRNEYYNSWSIERP